MINHPEMGTKATSGTFRWWRPKGPAWPSRFMWWAWGLWGRLGRLKEQIEQLLQDVKRLAGDAISVEWRRDDHLEPLETDRGQCRHAVMALVRNAVDAMSDGGQLVLRTGRTELTADDLSASDPAQPGQFAWLGVPHLDTRGHGQSQGEGDGAGSITRRLADGVRRMLDRGR